MYIMFKTIYLKPEENEEIKRLAKEAGMAQGKFMVMKCLEKQKLTDTFFKPRKR